MASHFEEESENSSTDRDLSKLNNKHIINNEEYDAISASDPVNYTDPFLACFKVNKSVISESEENTPYMKTDKTELNITETKSTHVIYNTRALSNLAPTYMLEQFDKNLLVIFNHYEVTGFHPRKGSKEDEDLVISTFKPYGFEIERHKDFTRKEILDELDSYSDRDFTDYGCIVVVVMTHGTDGGMIMAKDIMYNERDILNRLKARDKPTLVTKPIILLIQACRGTGNTDGVPVNRADIPKVQQVETTDYYLPLEADTLVFHSCYIGKPAHRPPTGSWFIQTLCKGINKMSDKHDLESIMTEVKRQVACNFEYKIKNNRVITEAHTSAAQNTAQPGSSVILVHSKQMPTVTSTLIRKLYLIRKSENKATSTQSFTEVSPVNISSDAVDNLVVPISTILHSYNSEEQSDPCLCYLDHLDYMRNCLRHYISRNKDDNHARFLLESLPLERDSNTQLTKSKLENLSNYLLTRSTLSDYHKYMYFYGSVSDGQTDTRSMLSKETVASKWEDIKKCLPGVILGISAYVATHFVHNMINK